MTGNRVRDDRTKAVDLAGLERVGVELEELRVLRGRLYVDERRFNRRIGAGVRPIREVVDLPGVIDLRAREASKRASGPARVDEATTDGPWTRETLTPESLAERPSHVVAAASASTLRARCTATSRSEPPMIDTDGSVSEESWTTNASDSAAPPTKRDGVGLLHGFRQNSRERTRPSLDAGPRQGNSRARASARRSKNQRTRRSSSHRQSPRKFRPPRSAPPPRREPRARLRSPSRSPPQPPRAELRRSRRTSSRGRRRRWTGPR